MIIGKTLRKEIQLSIGREIRYCNGGIYNELNSKVSQPKREVISRAIWGQVENATVEIILYGVR